MLFAVVTLGVGILAVLVDQLTVVCTCPSSSNSTLYCSEGTQYASACEAECAGGSGALAAGFFGECLQSTSSCPTGQKIILAADTNTTACAGGDHFFPRIKGVSLLVLIALAVIMIAIITAVTFFIRRYRRRRIARGWLKGSKATSARVQERNGKGTEKRKGGPRAESHAS